MPISKENKLAEAQRGILEVKLTPKQQSLLNILSDPDNAEKTIKEKALLAGLNEASYYRVLRNPEFLKAIKIRGILKLNTLALPIIDRVSKDALNGGFMQQRLALQMAGHYEEKPIISQVIQFNQDTAPNKDIDREILRHITGKEDIQDVVFTEQITKEEVQK